MRLTDVKDNSVVLKKRTTEKADQVAELFGTFSQNIGQHIANILNEGELENNSVIKDFLTTEINCWEIPNNSN